MWGRFETNLEFHLGGNLKRLSNRLSFSVAVPLLASLAFTFSGCTKSASNGVSADPNFNPIMSTRPQTATDTVLILKLAEAPLLTSMKVVEGKKQIDTDAAEAIKKEQEDVIAKLTALSPKIQVLYRYRLVINGLAIVAPIDQLGAIRTLGNVAYVETQTSFTRPAIQNTDANAVAKAIARTSVQFIGADQAHAKGIRGQGMKVGIIDTGIDYTHAMFGGAGTEDAYKAVDPSKESSLFPSTKVVGGIDLVGTVYDSDSADYSKRTPIVDKNPLDEGGHGSHVAGTVAGHGDGVNTYDGVAPDALLYAIKVFGADGSTGDAVVVAGLEYAADPNSDLDLADELDVVNLSLGSSYGAPHILYTEAMQNLSKAGTVVVASAGNSGDEEYIVGAPSVADEAISVAASVDDMDQNWKFDAVRFTTPSEPAIIVEAIEGTIGKPLSEIGDITGPLVYIGLADQELTPEIKAAVQGKVAFIDRGVVTFEQKIKRASEAGAIGVVVANNQDGEPIAMGGDGKYDLPAIMIKKDLGAKLKAELANGAVTIAFKTPDKIEKPELIDTITGFSSKGPRSVDALLKPEIAAPGSLIISAKMGGGAAGVQMSGTSMAAPHMAGVMALLKQTQPTLSSRELKSLAMSTAKSMVDAEKVPYPLSRQGAGRVQVMKALEAKVVSEPTAISLGEVTLVSKKQMRREVAFKNISKDEQTFEVVFEADKALRMSGPATLTLAAGETKTLTLDFTLDATTLAKTSTELDGLLKLTQSGVEVSRVPVLAIANKVSQVEAKSLVVHSTSAVDSQGATVDMTLKNSGVNAGETYLFNLLGRGSRKTDTHHDAFMERGCDLQEAGYRVVQKEGEAYLQFSAKLYEPLTTWDTCEVSILIDSDKDGVADQELVGIKQDHLKGLSENTFASVLLDATAARAIRKKFEQDTVAKVKDITEDYKPAVQAISSMFAPNSSTIAIVEVPVAALKLNGSGNLSIRMATSYQELSAIEADDYLNKNPKVWSDVSVKSAGAAFANMPEKITLAAGEEKMVSFIKGAGAEKLLMLTPTNAPLVGGLRTDAQSSILKPTYSVELLANH
jgi:minor extracellular serine protease Vpr